MFVPSIREPNKDKIIISEIFVHPTIGANTDLAAQKLYVIQSKRRTWSAEAFFANPSFISRHISATLRPRNG